MRSSFVNGEGERSFQEIGNLWRHGAFYLLKVGPNCRIVAPPYSTACSASSDRSFAQPEYRPARRVLLEVRRAAVVLQRRLVLVLLIDQHCRRLALHKVREEVVRSRAPAWRPPQSFRRISSNAARSPSSNFMRTVKLIMFSPPMPPKRLVKLPAAVIVWSRSGPVEIIPIFAPVSRSTGSRYSLAALGSFSNSVMPSVDEPQPFSLVHHTGWIALQNPRMSAGIRSVALPLISL